MGKSLLKKKLSPDEMFWEKGLRPSSFNEFPGQPNIKEKLQIFLKAAQLRKEPLDHMLFYGPPGLGKTTLAYIIANELGVPIKTTSGPALDKKGDIAALLTAMKENAILFIDEIHRMNMHIEEYLYSAMEDYYIDIITGDGLGAQSMKFQLNPFTLIGATTRVGLLNSPFRNRFGIVERLYFYNPEDLTQILLNNAKKLKCSLAFEAATEISKRSRGTPRVANRLLKRVRDYAEVQNQGKIDLSITQYALKKLEVDEYGLEEMDRKILKIMIEMFNGGPVGIESLASALSEERGSIEDVYEPYLLQEGFIKKTPRGRIAGGRAYEHCGLPIPKHLGQQIHLI